MGLDFIKHGGPFQAEAIIVLEPGDNFFTSKEHKSLLMECLRNAGIDPTQVAIIRCAPAYDEEMKGDDTAIKHYIHSYREKFLKVLSMYEANVVIAIGSQVLTQFMGSVPFKVSDYSAKVKEIMLDKPRHVIAVTSLNYAIDRIDPIPTFKAEFTALTKFKENNYEYSKDMFVQSSLGYEWRIDLSDILENKPKSIAFDTETTGLDWKLESVYPIVGQMTWQDGQSALTPLSDDYFADYFKSNIDNILTFINKICGNSDVSDINYTEYIAKIISQWKEILEDPNVKVIGHNIKFDMHMISKVGIEVKNVFLDTLQALHAIDENSKKRNLDMAVKQYIPDLYGYADMFNEETDKGKMIDVHPEDMISYAGGDTDATFRLAKVLYRLGKQDPDNFNVLMKVRMPAIKSLYRLEKTGIRIDVDKLPTLSQLVDLDLKERRIELMKAIPKKILRKHVWEKELVSGKADVLVPSNRELMTDAFFSEDGCNFEPVVFTKGTSRKKNSKDKVPKLSVKDHLSFFFDSGDELLFLYEEYQKISKLASTYIGNDDDEEKLKGLYKYIYTNPLTEETRVHTSFAINTTTGRTSSKEPNVQNLPQGRGDENSTSSKTAKGYKELFIPRKGYKMVEIDYSQAEVRLVAQASQDPNLLEIYRKGLDVYKAVAATVIMKITIEEFEQLPKNIQKAKRQAAKAVVLGFLYGMFPKKFKTYAKTTFNVDFTIEEAEKVREDFFIYFAGVARWHEEQKKKVHSDTFIKSLHGATRHLPGIQSKDKWIVLSNERDAINNPIQGFASDMGLIALDIIYKDFDAEKVRPINFVHDAIYFEIKEELVEEYSSYLKWYMENIPLNQMFNLKLDLPLIAEVEVGNSFADKKELECTSVRPDFCTL